VIRLFFAKEHAMKTKARRIEIALAGEADREAIDWLRHDVLALSGVRAAYWCGPERLMAPLRPLTPPWAVSLPAQVAVVEALKDAAYYRACYARTRRLRDELSASLVNLGIREPGGASSPQIRAVGNFVLCYLPANGPGSAAVVEACRARGLFLRDVGSMGTSLGSHAIRIAVKDESTQGRIVRLLSEVLGN